MKTLGLILIFSSFWMIAGAQNPAQGDLYSESGDLTVEIDASDDVNSFWKGVDDLVVAFDYSHIRSYDKLAHLLTESFSDDESRARSIYSWIALNISYDTQSINDGSFREKQDAMTVWENKTAICEGFANLFREMCLSAGLQARVVKGYVKEFTASDFQFPNHAWNGIQIDGKWKLLDVTWASVRIGMNQDSRPSLSNKFHRLKLDRFFLVEPARMIYTHLPEDPLWQLQEKYVNLEGFIEGADRIEKILETGAAKQTNFEELIASYDALDSLDQAISYLERMECLGSNRTKNYGLGIAYYYKAQQLLSTKNTPSKSAMVAKSYYEKSLEQLSNLKEEDFGYQFSKDLTSSMEIRIASLQRSQLTNF